ncbi:hypothetical protein [Winogradskyella haliclonae]|uniref:Uncharacterized protein n=1 Tax=Winogradskyella haliclonae TaxID=2048558 RepID=A0ABQ2BWB7_9FLAO|nr:hypothetical protein [Winogradskyella haliclonae]GGI56729.1 hypothetical protein GCM10011444_10380 [Winogradskyella haliclonae]
MPGIINVTISQIDDGENFQSPETPLAYCSSLAEDKVNVTVIAPFHNNVYANQMPSIEVSGGEDGNDVSITPIYNHSTPLSAVYTQVIKISFTLTSPVLDGNGNVVINISVDEEGLTVTNPGELGDPIRKTKVITNGEG